MDISFVRGRREWGVGKESKRKGADTVIQWQCSGRNTGGSRCKSFQEALSTGCSVKVTGNSDDDQLGWWQTESLAQNGVQLCQKAGLGCRALP